MIAVLFMKDFKFVIDEVNGLTCYGSQKSGNVTMIKVAVDYEAVIVMTLELIKHVKLIELQVEDANSEERVSVNFSVCCKGLLKLKEICMLQT